MTEREGSTRPVTGWRRKVQRFVSQQAATRLLSKFVARIDRPILVLTKGHFSPSGFLAGWPVVNLQTTGAKSGQARITPLIGFPDGEKIILIASNYGQTRNPAWYYNLVAHPVAWLTFKGRSQQYQATEATGAERERYWGMAVSAHSGYQDYQSRAGRTIPVMVLSPIEEKGEGKPDLPPAG
ncbi:MAG: nitroreductase family deazaflavin-dependent oxidoreductase [Anaerolineales bacterium]|nr:nitroreductase family deazaflavin-dependent oxidoreductase [Anaerolineales bacterium]